MSDAAGVLVACRDSGRVLLGLRAEGTKNAGTWAVFGGRIERGEDASDAASRELHEEAGVDLDPSDLQFLHERGRAGDGLYTTFLYVVEGEDDLRIRLNDEHEDFDWFDLEDVHDLPLHEGAAALFDDLPDLLDLVDEW